MQNLLIIVPCISFGGLEKVAVTTAEALKDFFNVYVVYFYKTDKQHVISERINVCCFDTPYGQNIIAQLKVMFKRNWLLKKYKKQNKIDISLSIGKVASISNVLSKVGKVTIASLHGYTDIPKTYAIKLLDKMLFSKADKVICVSKALESEFISSTNIDKNKTTFLYNPFNVSEILQKSLEPCNGLCGKPILFTYGRIVKEKNFESQIMAMHKILKSYPNAVLNILGDGDNKENLQLLAKEQGLSSNVFFLNQTDNPFKYLSKADLFITTSFTEGFGNTVIEAMICKTPIIATDCKVGIRENLYMSTDINLVATQVEFADFGTIVPPFYYNDEGQVFRDKVEVLANAICETIQNKELVQGKIQKAFLKSKDYDLKAYKEKLLKILEN